MRVAWVDAEREFEALRKEWDGLLAVSRQDGPFLSHGWQSSWWTAFRTPNHALSIATCRDDAGELLGVLPLFTTWSGRVVQTRLARFIGHDMVGSVGLSAFARPDVETTVFARFAREMRDTARWDVADLRTVDLEHGFLEHLEGVRCVSSVRDWCPQVALPADWDAYLASLTKHVRHEVRRCRSRAAEAGLALRPVREASEVDRAVSDLLTLHERRMRTKFGDSFRVPSRRREFMSRVSKTLFAEDRLRLMFLSGDGRPVAGLYLLRYEDAMYALVSGFDDTEAGAAHAGRALWSYAIEQAIREGCHTFDMLLGADPYKFEWGVTNVRSLSRVHLYNRSLVADAVMGRDAMLDAARRALDASPAPVRRFTARARATLGHTWR